jgi:hypothetical protein
LGLEDELDILAHVEYLFISLSPLTSKVKAGVLVFIPTFLDAFIKIASLPRDSLVDVKTTLLVVSMPSLYSLNKIRSLSLLRTRIASVEVLVGRAIICNDAFMVLSPYLSAPIPTDPPPK